MKKIAIFWWAFNPPTLWHYHIIEQIFKHSDTQKILIIPDWLRLDKEYNISEIHRKNLIKIFINDLIIKWYNIELDSYFLEWKNNSDTTTYEVDQYFIKKYWFQAYHIFWTDISSWIKYWTWNPNKYIQKKLKKIFIPRSWYDFDDFDLENFKLLNADFSPNISSTLVKEFIRENQDFSPFLSEKIYNYVLKNWLYKNL